MAYKKFETVSGGRPLSVETGHVAEQANGAIMIRSGDTVLLVTAVGSKEPREGIDFFPLTCDYEEKLYATGRIPGAFMRREGRPSEAAILACRMIDRPMRPLFPKDFRNDVQIVATVLSTDQENDPTTLAVTGASLALAISDIPHGGPVACVRVGQIDGQLVLNPTLPQLATSELDLVVAGTGDAISMVEAGAKQLPEARILEALRLAHEEIKKLVQWQNDIVAALGAKPKMQYPPFKVPEDVASAVHGLVADRIGSVLRNPDKAAREAAIDGLKKEVAAQLEERFPEQKQDISNAYHDEVKKAVRSAVINEGIRPDGRKPEEIRPITSQVGLLPRTHGSALFTRGQTQALSIVTMGTVQDQQKLDGLGLDEFKRYMHHYNFPPFSVGEAKPLRSPGRREIGHGALAERALFNVMPSPEDFPYVVRVVTEILSSNGSTSMASVCGSSLSLMDAGVPIAAPVAGIAMGLMTDESGKATVLSDIQGMEDELGDMDFKVAGTEKGITALQMDIKIKGLKWELVEQALAQAREGRMHIMGKMAEAITAPRAEMSPWAPRIETIKIDPDHIRDLIGPGGKNIRRIVEESGATIDVEDDGTVMVASNSAEARNKAMQMIHEVTDDVEIGNIYKGKVTRLMSFGAFVEIMPKKEGLIRMGNLAEHRVDKVEDVVNVGDEVMVKVIEIDDRGRINLSRKDAIASMRDTTGDPTPTPEATGEQESVGATSTSETNN